MPVSFTTVLRIDSSLYVMVTNPADVLLQEFAECADPDRSEILLEALIVEHALPGVRKIVRGQLAFRGVVEAQDVEHVASEVLLELLSRLRGIQGHGAAIGAFSGYTAASAYHACNEYLRRRYPNRHRLKTRLRYLLSNEKALALWEDGDAGWMCGLARWQAERPAPAPRDRIERWRDLSQDIPRGKDAIHPADLVSTLLERMGGPVPFDDLVGMTGAIWGIDDPPPARDLGSGELDPAARMDLNRWMADFWAQTRELPVAERLALLLNLRTAGGQAAVALLPLTRVAGVRQIAAALELPADEFAGMWNRLPLDDLAIAERLGVSRQRVIHLRKSARERLTRRMGRESQRP